MDLKWEMVRTTLGEKWEGKVRTRNIDTQTNLQ